MSKQVLHQVVYQTIDAEAIAKVIDKRRAFLIFDAGMAACHADRLASLIDLPSVLGFAYIMDGERMKTLETAQTIINDMLSVGLDRGDVVIGIGGGVVTDVTGFVASIYKRGLATVLVPTTLLAIVDAAIGGKTGVNTMMGKNLIGTFHAPEKVMIDTSFLDTLPVEEWRNGLGEIIKYAFLTKKVSLKQIYALKNEDLKALTKWIPACVKYKQTLVSEDFKESNQRMVLNLGHTFGHCLETAFQYERFGHGEAVMYGLLVMLYLSVKWEGLSPLVFTHYKTWLMGQTWWDEDILHHPEYLYEGILNDKKAHQGTLRIILLKARQEPVIRSYSYIEIVEAIKEMAYDHSTH